MNAIAFTLPDFTTANIKTGEIVSTNGTFADTSHKRSLSKLITDINALGLQVRDVSTIEHNYFAKYHRAGFGFYSNAVTSYTTTLEICNANGDVIGSMKHTERHEKGVTITVAVTENLINIRGMRNVAWIVI